MCRESGCDAGQDIQASRSRRRRERHPQWLLGNTAYSFMCGLRNCFYLEGAVYKVHLLLSQCDKESSVKRVMVTCHCQLDTPLWAGLSTLCCYLAGGGSSVRAGLTDTTQLKMQNLHDNSSALKRLLASLWQERRDGVLCVCVCD